MVLGSAIYSVLMIMVKAFKSVLMISPKPKK